MKHLITILSLAGLLTFTAYAAPLSAPSEGSPVAVTPNQKLGTAPPRILAPRRNVRPEDVGGPVAPRRELYRGIAKPGWGPRRR
jgi:hypothetical protein